MVWDLSKQKTIFECRPFKVEELTFSDREKPYYRLNAPEWCNVFPVTVDGRAILIRQYRQGVMRTVLETPGGVIDSSEKDPTMAAMRELEEETGFTSQRVLPLAVINPNPAIMDNRTHFFVALGCYPNPNRKHFPEGEEDEIRVELTALSELDTMIRTGRIDHALSALCIMMGMKYVKVPS